MSSFEFILVSIAIVVGFGISEILAGWGRQLRHRYAVRPYPLQIVASGFVLSLSLRYMWTLWILQGVRWTYLGYLLVFLPALILALSAHLIRVEVESVQRLPRDQYFGSQRPFFLLLAAFPVLGTVNVWYNAEHFRVTYGSLPELFQLVWPVSIAAFVWLAVSRDPRHHWIGWALAWASNVVVSVSVLPALG